MKNIRVAVIEDHHSPYSSVGEALKKRGEFEVVGEASSGVHGLKLLESARPDVAIIDIGLPDIDGIEVVRRFRQTQSPAEKLETKIVVLTAYKAQDALLEAFAAGADSYCIKDSLDKVEEAIRLTHEGNPWIDPSIATVVATQARPSDEATEDIIKNYSVSTAIIEKLEEEYKDIFQTACITEQETEIFLLIVQGYDNDEIASQLNMTIDDAETSVCCISNKFHAFFCEAVHPAHIQ
jgi:two-component system, NarL family, response regulator LiaR